MSAATTEREEPVSFPPHKGSLTLEHNDHKSYYETVEEWDSCNDLYSWKDDAAKERAITLNEIWTLQWYPETPNGFMSIVAPTLEELLQFANSAQS